MWRHNDTTEEPEDDMSFSFYKGAGREIFLLVNLFCDEDSQKLEFLLRIMYIIIRMLVTFPTKHHAKHSS